MKSTPFSRIAGIMAMAQSLMTNTGLSAMQALKQAGAADYRSTREAERHCRQGLHNAVVNGFTIMQQRSKGAL